MCGRYRRTTQEEELARLYHIPIPKQTDLPISYNIAPSQKVLTIRFNPEIQQRSLDALQWGLVPYWRHLETGSSLRRCQPVNYVPARIELLFYSENCVLCHFGNSEFEHGFGRNPDFLLRLGIKARARHPLATLIQLHYRPNRRLRCWYARTARRKSIFRKAGQ